MPAPQQACVHCGSMACELASRDVCRHTRKAKPVPATVRSPEEPPQDKMVKSPARRK